MPGQEILLPTDMKMIMMDFIGLHIYWHVPIVVFCMNSQIRPNCTEQQEGNSEKRETEVTQNQGKINGCKGKYRTKREAEIDTICEDSGRNNRKQLHETERYSS
jgi:hypothetical protein